MILGGETKMIKETFTKYTFTNEEVQKALNIKGTISSFKIYSDGTIEAY